MKSQLKVLIMDDEPIVCKRLKPYLEKAGYEVEIFFDGPSALKRVQEKTFDIVVTDLKMEGFDGIQLLEEVKQRSPHSEVIVITGFATIETAKESFHKGAFDFIAKPFKLNELRKIIERAEAKLREKDVSMAKNF